MKNIFKVFLESKQNFKRHENTLKNKLNCINLNRVKLLC